MKAFRSYAMLWGVVFALYHILSLAIPKSFDADFWVSYIVTTLAFLAQLYVGYRDFRAGSTKNSFYHIPAVTISAVGVGVLALVGVITAIIPAVPAWLSVVLCALIVGFTAFATIGTASTADAAVRMDRRVKVDTFFIRSLTADAELLLKNATPSQAPIVRQVYEAARYSDPVSHEELAGLEAQITVRFRTFEGAVAQDSNELNAIALELCALLSQRNKTCKLLK